LKKSRIENYIVSCVIILSLPLATWCIYGEKWRLFREKERQAYEENSREFRALTGPVIKTMLEDLNRAIRESPLKPSTENQGRTWVLHLPGEGGPPRRVSYTRQGEEPVGIIREEEGKGPPLFFPLAIKSMEFRKTGEATWQCAFIREMRTRYGYMGDDWVLYTFGKNQ